MAESTFDDLLHWLQEHSGRSVYLEVGTEAQDIAQPAAASRARCRSRSMASSRRRTSFAQIHCGQVRLDGGDQNQLYLEPDRITKIVIHRRREELVLEAPTLSERAESEHRGDGGDRLGVGG